MGGVVTEEQAIIHAQYLNLVYFQSFTLYNLILNAPHPTLNPSRPSTEPPANGILNYVQKQLFAKSTKKQNQHASQASHTLPNSKTASVPIVSTRVNGVQSSESSGTNKKGRNKINNSTNQQEYNKMQNTDGVSRNKR